MANEALVVLHMFCSLSRRVVDLVYIHGVWISMVVSHPWLGLLDVAVSSSSEPFQSYHILIELPGFIKPLLPFPSGLLLTHREGNCGHHDSQLVGDSSLEGVDQDVVGFDTTTHLGQVEGSGELVRITTELVHSEGVQLLVCPVCKVLWYEGLDEVFVHPFKDLLFKGGFFIQELQVPTFCEGGPLSLTHLIEHDQQPGLLI